MPDTRARVCLVTPGHPATNPRLVKEADALVESGYEVEVVAAFAGDWASEAESGLMARRRWTLDLVDWHRDRHPWRYWRSGARHRAAGHAAGWSARPGRVAEHAVSRVSRELRVRAGRHRADLFIAHNLGALPAAARAAFRQGARLGFDAEDFHSGQLSGSAPSGLRAATLSIEQRFIPACDYLTASAPGIADAYQTIAYRAPIVVLNVSSRQDRAGLTLRDPAEGPLRMYWFSQTIGPGRGLEDVVRAMGMVRAPVELHLRGTWAAGYEASLRRLMQDCGVPDDRVVAYRPGAPDEMVRLAADFDLGLALEPGHTPNNAAAVSNKLFTYLMAGLAVIVSRTPGQTWLLDRVPAAGWTYHPGSAFELSTLIGALAADRWRLRSARIAAWEAAGARFCWEMEQRRFLEAVSSALQNPRRDKVESAVYPDARLERLR